MNVNDLLTTEPHMSEDDKRLRDRYVEEYIKDYNTLNAAVRMNYVEDSALEFAKQMWNDPYVQRKIAEAQQSRCSWMQAPGSDSAPATDYGHDESSDKQRIINQLFKEMYATGAGSSQQGRISAAKELARIYKLGEPEQDDSKVLTNVMIVPAVGSVDDWAAMAKESQAKLKEQVKQ